MKDQNLSIAVMGDMGVSSTTETGKQYVEIIFDYSIGMFVLTQEYTPVYTWVQIVT